MANIRHPANHNKLRVRVDNRLAYTEPKQPL
jgi:hypothetical protein